MKNLKAFSVLTSCILTLVCYATSARAQSASLDATDDAFEDRVELSWSLAIPSGQFFRIERDGAVLGIRSRTETSFVDRSGNPGRDYTYCVIPTDAASTDGTPMCDLGRRSILSAGSVEATDRTLEDRVGVTWTDRSEVEAAYRVYRTTVAAADSTLLATLGANRTFFNDDSAITGTTYRYCVVAVDDAGFTSNVACDNGTRGAVLPPAAVAASDGQFNDRVRVTWVDQTATETGYSIYRSGTKIGSVGANETLYDDLQAAVGVDNPYCVSATIDGIESVMVCDTGRRGALAPPETVVATDNLFDDRVDLSWSDAGDTEDGFVVSRYIGENLDVTFPELAANAESFSDPSASQEVTYSYCVQAFSDADEDNRSVSTSICDDGTRSAVLAPTSVSASDKTFEDRTEITWSSSSATVMLFNIYRDGVLVDNVPANELVFADTQIASGPEYNYCVSAMTVTGASTSLQGEIAELVRSMRRGTEGQSESTVDGAAIEIESVRPDPQAVLLALSRLASNKPTLKQLSGRSENISRSDLDAQLAAAGIVESESICDTGSRLLNAPSDVVATFETYEDRVEITWTDNSEVERGHHIYRKGPADEQPLLVGTANTGRNSFGDFRGTPGVTYTYSVRAFDLRGPGGESSADSDNGGRKLEEPTGLATSTDVSETSISFEWTDNSRAETGYEIRRDGVVLSELAANAMTFTDSAPVIGVEHNYEVTAVDSLGRSETATLAAGTELLAPGSFAASDSYLDRIVLVWQDETIVGTGYSITRNGEPLATLPAGSNTYIDETVASREQYTYCATTIYGNGPLTASSPTVCDIGASVVTVTDAKFQRFDAPTNPTPYFGNYGYNIATAGRLAVVGAPGLGETRGPFADGAAYIYEQDPVSLLWSQSARLVPENPQSTSGDRFGWNVAASGNTVAVTSPSACATETPNCATPAGEVAIWVRDESSGAWSRKQTITATTGTYLGWSVAVDDDALLVGANGLVFVYGRSAEADPFVFEKEISIGNLSQVHRLAISGSYAIAAGYDTAVILHRSDDTGEWVAQTSLTAPSVPGYQSALLNDGTGAAISGDNAFVSGLVYNDALQEYNEVVWVYQRNPATGAWQLAPDPAGTITPPETDLRPDIGDGFGARMSASGGLLAIGAHEFGADVSQQYARGRIFLYSLTAGTGVWEPLYELGPDGRPQLRTIESAADEYRTGGALAVTNDKLVYAATSLKPPTEENTGVVYLSTEPIGDLLVPPTSVAATDGDFKTRVQVQWNDEALDEDGYRIYRDGKLVAELAANSESYSDFDIAAGSLAEYCVHTFRSDLVATASACDFGWRPPDGAISGSVRAPQTQTGLASSASAVVADAGQRVSATDLQSTPAIIAAATDSVLICIAPDPDRGILFDGSGGSVRIPFGSLSGPFTIEFWTNRAALDNQEHAVISVGSAGSTQQVSARFLADGTLRFTVGATDLDYADANPLGWHHWALTKASSGERQIIRDGVLVQSDASPASALVGGLLVLGSDADTTSFFSGTLDEVRVWNVAQTPTQVISTMGRRLEGNESGLLGYWAMNQGRGRAVGDDTNFGHHGTMHGGVSWSTAGAIRTCVLADTQGKYTLGGVRYNESTTFTVTPRQTQRVFDPPASDVTLSIQHPVENQLDFIDVTQLGVSGHVVFEGTECPVPDADILVDGVSRGSTQSDGSFMISVQPSEGDSYRFAPQKANANDASDTYGFVPSRRNLVADQALFGVDFSSTKTRPLHAYFGASCESIGSLGTITIEVSTENGCYQQTYEVSGDLDIDLPPQKYLVRVTDVQFDEPELRADMIQYFDNVGVQEIDLTNDRDTLDLTYHAPIGMTIAGLPAADPQCTTYTTADGASLPLTSVLQQGRTYSLTMNVSEDYGSGRVCPVNNGTVAVYDAIADSANTKRTYRVEDGKVLHRTLAVSPNVFKGASVNGVNRSYQKSFTAVAEVPGRDPFSLTEWVIVEGVRARTSEFVSATTDPFPLLIVHDPPGTNSEAYLEKGTTTCSTMSSMYLGGGAGGGSVDVTLGYSPIVGFGVATKYGGGLTFKAKTLAGATYGNTGALQICASTTEKFSTSGDTGWSGEDVYMGVALNLVFARADELVLNQCEIAVTERLAADLDTENAFETTYIYGETHIRDSLIPDLEELIELSGGDPSLTGDPNGDGNEETVRLTQALANWKKQLANNQVLKAQALDGTVENISFSAGADYEYSHTADTTRSTTETVRIYVDTENSIGGVLTVLGYDQTFLATVQQHFERVTEDGSSVQTTHAMGYTLSDGDTGDFFSVDIGTDPRYGTPVFGTVSGRSSNPWEANTQRRDWPLLSINPPVQHNVPPDEVATFTVSLTNATESGERREYVVAPIRQSNPGSAALNIGGTVTGGTYLVAAGETQEITVSVGRGASRYSYEDLELIAYPALDYAIWQADSRQSLATSDTARFSVYYEAPCSDIAILRPRAPWSINASQIVDSLEVILRDFDLNGSDIFDVNRIGFQFRRSGSPDWFPGRSVSINRSGAAEADSLDAQARSWIARWRPQRDGDYQLRAFTQCSSGDQVYSEPVAGVVDTKAPKPLGTPEPADAVLTFGGTISATFDEPIACSTISLEGNDANASVTYLDGPLAGSKLDGFDPVCDGTTVVLTPPEDFDWTPAEGRLVQVSLDAVADIYGNPVSAPVRWQFTVRRSAFAWAPANLEIEIPRGTQKRVQARLVNGSAQPVVFQTPDTIELLPENGSSAIPLDVTGSSGNVVARGEHNISFTIPDSLLPGRYTATLMATRIVNDAPKEETPLYVTADVVCRAPDWQVNPAAFENSMTVVARLVVNGEVSTDSSDVIVAMVNGEVRGVAHVTEPAAGAYRVQMLVYGDGQGDLVQFQVWDADQCMLYRETSKAFLFRSGQSVGTFADPVELQAPPAAVPQAVQLAAGWTWFSTNRVAPDASLNAMLAGVIAAPGDLIKGQTAYAQYDAASGWVGTLKEITNGQGYFARLQQSNVLLQNATATDPTSPILLNNGWTWIGYLPTSPIETNDALASLDSNPGDLIKSQYAFAEYVDGTGWVGSLTDLSPGLGYLIYAAEGGTLTYPAARPSTYVDLAPSPDPVGAEQTMAAESRDEPTVTTASQLGEEATDSTRIAILPWTVAVDDYAETMTVVAEVQRNGLAIDDPNLEIGLFAADGLRGAGRIVTIDETNRARAFIMVYGNEPDETLTISIRDIATGKVVDVNQHVTFAANGRAGTVGDALIIETESEAALPTEFALEQNYPNPFRSETQIRYALPEPGPVQIEVFDVIGRRVAVVLDEPKVDAGWHTARFDATGLASGTYWYRVNAGESKDVRKMLLVK